MILYHVDTGKNLVEGMSLTLKTFDAAEMGEENAVEWAKFGSFWNKLHPDGFSLWGWRILAGQYADAQPREFACEEWRLKACRDRPSRLQSIFAHTSLQDVDRFFDVNKDFADRPVFRLTTESEPFLGDQSYISGADPDFCDFESYWLGKSCTNRWTEAVLKLPVIVGARIR